MVYVLFGLLFLRISRSRSPLSTDLGGSVDRSLLAHPTLNRHSPPEMVANFKRRVPPRPPKGKRRPEDVGAGSSSLSASSSKSGAGMGGMMGGGGSKLPSLSASVDNNNSMQYGSLQPVIAPPQPQSNDPLLSGGSGVGMGGLGGV